MPLPQVYMGSKMKKMFMKKWSSNHWRIILFKANCEDILLRYNSKNFNAVVIRPATVCGYSLRQRFDLLNILTNLALNKKPITVFGGNQLRPNIHKRYDKNLSYFTWNKWKSY